MKTIAKKPCFPHADDMKMITACSVNLHIIPKKKGNCCKHLYHTNFSLKYQEKSDIEQKH